jgi:hypothetical protein
MKIYNSAKELVKSITLSVVSGQRLTKLPGTTRTTLPNGIYFLACKSGALTILNKALRLR